MSAAESIANPHGAGRGSGRQGDHNEWGWDCDDAPDGQDSSMASPGRPGAHHPHHSHQNTNIPSKQQQYFMSPTRGAGGMYYDQQGITSSPSFQELEHAIGATLALSMNGSHDEQHGGGYYDATKYPSPNRPNSSSTTNQRWKQQQKRQHIQKQQQILNSSNPSQFLHRPTPIMVGGFPMAGQQQFQGIPMMQQLQQQQQPLPPLGAAKEEFSPFIITQESRGLVLFHSPYINQIQVRDACQTFGVLLYIRPEFHSRGVTLVGYYDIRCAIRAVAELGDMLKELGNSVANSLGNSNADGTQTPPLPTIDASAHYTVVLHLSNNSDESQLLVRPVPPNISIQDLSDEVFSKFGDVKKLERVSELGPSSPRGVIKRTDSVDSLSGAAAAAAAASGSGSSGTISSSDVALEINDVIVEYYNIQDCKALMLEFSGGGRSSGSHTFPTWTTNGLHMFHIQFDAEYLRTSRFVNALLAKWRTESSSSPGPGVAAAAAAMMSGGGMSPLGHLGIPGIGGTQLQQPPGGLPPAYHMTMMNMSPHHMYTHPAVRMSTHTGADPLMIANPGLPGPLPIPLTMGIPMRGGGSGLAGTAAGNVGTAAATSGLYPYIPHLLSPMHNFPGSMMQQPASPINSPRAYNMTAIISADSSDLGDVAVPALSSGSGSGSSGNIASGGGGGGIPGVPVVVGQGGDGTPVPGADDLPDGGYYHQHQHHQQQQHPSADQQFNAMYQQYSSQLAQHHQQLHHQGGAGQHQQQQQHHQQAQAQQAILRQQQQLQQLQQQQQQYGGMKQQQPQHQQQQLSRPGQTPQQYAQQLHQQQQQQQYSLYPPRQVQQQQTMPGAGRGMMPAYNNNPTGGGVYSNGINRGGGGGGGGGVASMPGGGGYPHIPPHHHGHMGMVPGGVGGGGGMIDTRPTHHQGHNAIAARRAAAMMSGGQPGGMGQGGPGGGQGHPGGGAVFNSNADAEYMLDVNKIADGTETRTTIMIRNIPNKYKQHMLLEEVNAHHEGTYDFFYLPIDFKNKCNVGYGFINFLDPLSIIPFVNEFEGARWRNFNSEKVCSITFARIQGKAAMVARFQNSSLLDKDDEYRPLLFYSSGPNRGLPEPFPVRRVNNNNGGGNGNGGNGGNGGGNNGNGGGMGHGGMGMGGPGGMMSHHVGGVGTIPAPSPLLYAQGGPQYQQQTSTHGGGGGGVPHY